jgi:hypothetical protein
VRVASNEHILHKLEAELSVTAPADVLFDALIDLHARSKDVPAFRQVAISNRERDGFTATMHESYGGRDVVIVSRFRYQRPAWLSYEHVQSPYGANRGMFTILDRGNQRVLHQVHETEQDVPEGSALRTEWLDLMGQLLASIKLDAETRAG